MLSSILAIVTPGRSEPRTAIAREPKPDQVVNRVSDNTLIEVTDLNLDVADFVGERTQVAQVAVPPIHIAGPRGNLPTSAVSSHS